MAYQATNFLGLARALRALAKVPSQLAAPFASFITAELQRGFQSGTDPYSTPWAGNAASTIRKKGHAQPNIGLTHALSSGTRAEPSPGAGVDLIAGAEHGRFAQGGTRNHPPRPPLPHKGMPPTWRTELQRLYSEMVKAAMG